jgi:hypothetical protein
MAPTSNDSSTTKEFVNKCLMNPNQIKDYKSIAKKKLQCA